MIPSHPAKEEDTRKSAKTKGEEVGARHAVHKKAAQKLPVKREKPFCFVFHFYFDAHACDVYMHKFVNEHSPSPKPLPFALISNTQHQSIPPQGFNPTISSYS